MTAVLEAILDGSSASSRLLSPAVGIWTHRPLQGTAVTAGTELGYLVIMGVRHRLVAPTGTAGFIADAGDTKSGSLPVQYGQTLLVLGTAELPTGDSPGGIGTHSSDGALVYRAASSGRYYVRAAPDKPAFVSPGDVIVKGQAVGLLEVMKTFSRIHLEGDGIPETVRVSAVVPSDGDDIDAGDIILKLELPQK